MDKFVEAYAAWPPVNQLILALVVLSAAVFLLAYAGWLLTFPFFYLTALFQGWPEVEAVDTDDTDVECGPAQPKGPLSVCVSFDEPVAAQFESLNKLLKAIQDIKALRGLDLQQEQRRIFQEQREAAEYQQRMFDECQKAPAEEVRVGPAEEKPA